MHTSEPSQPSPSHPGPPPPSTAPKPDDCQEAAAGADAGRADDRPAAVIIVGFGLPGRFVAEVLDARDIPYYIVELNPSNARSIAACGKRVICGDARNTDVLRSAGIDHARILALTLPDEKAVIEVLHLARRINPNVKMLARCNYTSTGIKAERAGAAAVLVEEQLVALEFAKLMSNTLE